MTKNTETETNDFVIPERWDSDYANDGVWFDMVDRMGNDWGSFLLAHFDMAVPRIKHAIERSARKANARARKQGGLKDEDAKIHDGIDVALDTFLLGWKVKGSAGKDIPFTRENVHRYFGTKREDKATSEITYPVMWIMDDPEDGLLAQARNPLNFQPDEQEELPEKN